MSATRASHPASVVVDLTRPAGAATTDLEARLEVVEGLLQGLRHIDTVNRAVRLSRDRFSALRTLQEAPVSLSERQASAVLAMPLGQQTFEETERLEAERDALRAHLKRSAQAFPEEPSLHWFG